MSEVKIIPKHWQIKKLGEVCKIVTGTTPSKSILEYYGTDFPFYKPTDLEQGVNTISSRDGLTLLGLQKGRSLPEKSILVTCIGATIGKTGLIKMKGSCNQQINAVLPNEMFSPTFLYYQIISKDFQQQIVSNAASTTLPILNKSKFEKLKIVVPPLVEQQLIVSKIEELLSDLDNGKKQLLTAQQQLKVYRQSLLKWAFEGKLTNINVKEGELPKGWHIKILDELSDMCLGKMLDKQKNKGSYHYYLRNVSVRWGGFDLDDLEQMRFENSEIERFGLKKDDLVICEGGEPGRCAIWKDAVPNMKIQKALHRVRVKNMLSVKFLFLYMYYAGMSGLLEKYFTGTTIKHLTGRELKKVRIPVPTISEQQLIVAELESKLTYCDKIEETISQSLLQAETLRQSILKKAFEGKLVCLNYDSDDVYDKHEILIAAEEQVSYKKSS